MSHLIIARGFPASGKSTWARSWVEVGGGRRIRVNRDDLRQSLFSRLGILSQSEEAEISRIEKSIARHALENGQDVVVDATNLRAKYARAWADLALEVEATWEVLDFKGAPLEELLRRDAKREHPVGEQVIRSLWTKFPEARWPDIEPSPEREPVRLIEPYVGDPTLPPAWLVDIDGTLADMQDQRGPFEWARVGQDAPHADVIHLVNLLSEHADVILMSGRDEVCHDATVEWLKAHGVRFSHLIMRRANDYRKDSIVKAELFDLYIRDFRYVLGVFDDRDQVVEMWRSAGLRVYQVAPGAF